MIQQERRILGLQPDLSVLPPPPPPDNGAQTLVTEGWEKAQDFATEAFDRATGFLQTLAAIADEFGNLPDITVDVGAITSQLVPYVAPPAPASPAT